MGYTVWRYATISSTLTTSPRRRRSTFVPTLPCMDLAYDAEQQSNILCNGFSCVYCDRGRASTSGARPTSARVIDRVVKLPAFGLKDRAGRTVHWREKKTSSKAWRLGFVAPFTVLRNGYYRLATASTGATCLGGEPFKCCGGPGTGNIMACKSYSR